MEVVFVEEDGEEGTAELKHHFLEVVIMLLAVAAFCLPCAMRAWEARDWETKRPARALGPHSTIITSKKERTVGGSTLHRKEP